MLVAECQPPLHARIDVAFQDLLSRIYLRLQNSKVIRNLAHPDNPVITKTASDSNVGELQSHSKEALEKINELDKEENNNADSAREVWDWIFKSDGFFKEFDEKLKQDEKRKALTEKAILITKGARTSSSGIIGVIGIANIPHRFYGEPSND